MRGSLETSARASPRPRAWSGCCLSPRASVGSPAPGSPRKVRTTSCVPSGLLRMMKPWPRGSAVAGLAVRPPRRFRVNSACSGSGLTTPVSRRSPAACSSGIPRSRGCSPSSSPNTLRAIFEKVWPTRRKPSGIFRAVSSANAATAGNPPRRACSAVRSLNGPVSPVSRSASSTPAVANPAPVSRRPRLAI